MDAEDYWKEQLMLAGEILEIRELTDTEEIFSMLGKAKRLAELVLVQLELGLHIGVSDVYLVAWLRDRAEQYDNDSGSKAAIEGLMRLVRERHHTEAIKHGELEDDLEWANAYLGSTGS